MRGLLFELWCLVFGEPAPRCAEGHCAGVPDPRCQGGNCTYHCQSVLGCYGICLRKPTAPAPAALPPARCRYCGAPWDEGAPASGRRRR